MTSYRTSRGPMPGQATMDAFLDAARALPRPLPLVGHVRHDGGMPGAVYVGRRVGGIPESPWGNPYKIGPDGDRAAVLAAYERHARARLAADPRWLDELRQARLLLCWCRRAGAERPACHGDVLVRLLRDWQERLDARSNDARS